MRYHGRDVALVRARARRRGGVLGSATPSLETLRGGARRAAQAALTLPERADARGRCRGRDRRPASSTRRADGLLSAPLLEALARDARRGRAGDPVPQPARLLDVLAVQARAAQAVRCRHCSVSLTYHRGDRPAASATTAASRRRRRRRCPRAARRPSSGWASAPSSSRQLLAVSASRRARGAARSRHRRRRRARARVLDALRARRDRRPGRHADGDQGPRLSRRHAGRRGAAPTRG